MRTRPSLPFFVSYLHGALTFSMNSLQVLSPLPSSSSATASTRSPSPDLPGAWPRTPSRHKRSQTCPVLTPAPMPKTTSPADMHLDRVVNFHQRLSLSLSGECEETNSPFVQPHFLASAVSDLTNCNTVQQVMFLIASSPVSYNITQDPESPLFAVSDRLPNVNARIY